MQINLKDLVGGALQEKFNKSFERVVDNMRDPNTSFKVKRAITIQLSFEQNEARDDVSCKIDVKEKLAPQSELKTMFSIGQDLKSGKLYAEEYGKQVKGQMSIEDYVSDEVDTETGEIIENTVYDFRKAMKR